MADPIAPIVEVAAALRRTVRVLRQHARPDHDHGQADLVPSAMVDERRELYEVLYGQSVTAALDVAEAICAVDRRPPPAPPPKPSQPDPPTPTPQPAKPPEPVPVPGEREAVEVLQALGIKKTEAVSLVKRAVDDGATGETEIVSAALKLRSVKSFIMPTYGAMQ